jgi:hypothetical protein
MPSANRQVAKTAAKLFDQKPFTGITADDHTLDRAMIKTANLDDPATFP